MIEQGASRQEALSELGRQRLSRKESTISWVQSIEQKAREQADTRTNFVPQEQDDITTQSVSERAEWEDLSGLDVGVKGGKSISEFWEDLKIEGTWFPTSAEDTGKAIGSTLFNFIPDAIQWAWEVIELVSDPVGTFTSIRDLWQGLSDKLVFSILNKITWSDVNPTEQEEIVNAVWRNLKETYGSVDKVFNEITENPVDVLLIGKSIISAAKKAKLSPETQDALKTAEKTYADSLKESAKKDVEQALWATKEKFKQKSRDISWWVAERWITGSRVKVQELAESNSGKYGKEIEEFIDSGKLTGTVSKKELLGVLDEIKKEWLIDDIVIDDSIVNAVDKFTEVINKFDDKIDAAKARELRQMFDKAVYNTKGIVSEEALSLKNNIKKWLWDNIRKQLSEQNPDLDKLNKEFSFYKTLDDVLTETLDRTWPQQGGLVGNIVWGSGLASGAVIFWDLTGAIATAAVAKWLSEALRSPRWRLAKATTKNKLASALAKWDKKAADSVARQIIKEVLWKKWDIYLTAQGTESNTNINR